MCFRLQSCCCGCSVETGTKIIAILGIIGSVLGLISNLISGQWGSVFGAILEVLICAMLYYGTVKRKPAFVMAWMVLAMIGIVLLVCIAFAALISGLVVDPQQLEQFIRDSTGTEVDGSTVTTIMLVTGALLLVVTLVDIYLWAVVYSFHKELQEGHIDQSGYIETGHGGGGMKMNFKQ